MKRKLLFIITVFALVLGLFACNPANNEGDNSGNNNDSPTSSLPENLIYNSTTDISLIFMGDEITDETATVVYNTLFPYVRAKYIHIYIDEMPEEAEHEIVVGKTDRDISKRAYAYLEREEYYDFGDCGYVIYSDGSSVAIAYTEALNYDYINQIVIDFATEYFAEELCLEPGIVKQEKVNLISVFEEEDAILQQQQWERLEKATSPKVVSAMQTLYKLYTPGVVSWLANLYEPRVCVCTTTDELGNKVCQNPLDADGNPLCSNGGFYYSNSARNTIGYLPDIESTNQALSLLESSGMLSTLGGRYANNLPSWMKNEIAAFVKGLQDEDGYFYHPQWSREMHHGNPERMGRDLSWAKSMLSNLGERPYYTTPDGKMQGVGRPSDIKLTSLLSDGVVSAVSKVIATSSLNAHLKDPETFRAYLEKLNIKTSSYGAGSTVGAQTATIKALDRAAMGIDDDTGFDYRNNGPLSKVLFDWLDENQNPKNGLWDAESDYQACDGLFKIVNIYNDYRLPMSYPLEAALATIAAISSDEPVYTVCNMYNAWANIGLIKKNINLCVTDADEKAQLITTINNAIVEVAPEALLITAEKTSNFLISDGSFSYLIGHSSENSTGMPVAVINSYEGDVNATLICIGGLIGHINNALDAPKVNPYGLADWHTFINIVESNNVSLKDPSMAGVAFDFENDAIDERPGNVTVSVGSGGSISVQQDPYNKNNQVLNINHPYAPGKGDSAKFLNYFYSLGRNCSIFDSDFIVHSEGTDNTYVAQFTLGGAYFFTFRLANGAVEIWEDSTTELALSKARRLASVPLDQWFNIRVEYYHGSHENVRIKFYLNETLIAVSSNYGDSSGKNIKNEAGTPRKGIDNVLVYPLSYVNLNMSMDNVLVTSQNIEYVSESETEGLVVNADAPDKDRVTYTFDSDELPQGFDITSGSGISVKDGKLSFDGSEKTVLTVKSNLRTQRPNNFAVGFDIDFTDAQNGEVLTFGFTEPQHYENKIIDITKHSIKCITEDGVKYLIVTSKSGTISFESTKIRIDDEPVSLEFVYYTKQKQTLIYINDKFIGLSDYYIPTNPHQYEFGYLTLTSHGKLCGTIDNLFVEAGVGDYAKETEPSVPRDIYDFEDTIDSSVTTTGTVENGALKLTDSEYIILPINKRVDTVFSAEFGFYADLSLSENGDSTRVSFLDGSGKTIAAIDIVLNNGLLELYEVTENGRYPTKVVTATFEGTANFKFTYYPKSDTITVKLSDTLILATSILYSADFGEVAKASVTSDGILVDNLYLDGMIFGYIHASTTATTQDDIDEVITYEHSSLGNLPNRVTATLVAGGASSGIAIMMRDSELTKVYQMTSASGGNDYVDFIYSGETTNKLIFETDLYLTVSGYFEIHVLSGSSSSNAGYRAILRSSGTNLMMYDTSSNSNHTPGPEMVIGKIGQWINLKIEADLGDGSVGSTKFNTYVNGELVYTSQNFFGSYKNDVPTLTSINRVRFYTWGSTTGSFIFDNSSLTKGECLHGNMTVGAVTTEPGCESEGAQEYICQNPNCNQVLVVAIPALGHDMGEWVIDTETTERCDCSRCDYFETREYTPPVEPEDPEDDEFEEGSGDFIDGDGWA